jgi:hypothetical protein
VDRYRHEGVPNALSGSGQRGRSVYVTDSLPYDSVPIDGMGVICRHVMRVVVAESDSGRGGKGRTAEPPTPLRSVVLGGDGRTAERL